MASAPIVKVAWAAVDESSPRLSLEGALTLLEEPPASTAQRVLFGASASVPPEPRSVVVALALVLSGGNSHVVRVTGTSAAVRGAYLSVCVAGDPSRELLPPEAATLAWSGSGRTALQVSFVAPSVAEAADNNAFDVRIRLREKGAGAGDLALSFDRLLLVDMGPPAAIPAPAAPAAPAAVDVVTGDSLFPELSHLELPGRIVRGLARAAVLTNEAEARYMRHVSAGQALVLTAIGHDLTLPLTGRKPALDLRCLYGPPATRQRLLDARWRFKINMPASDLHRDDYGEALVADPRGDSTYLSSQLLVLLARFHNKVMDHFQNSISQQGLPPVTNEELFARAHKSVVTHWQWAALYDTVYSIVDREVFRDVVSCGQSFFPVYSPDDAPAAPPGEYVHAIMHLSTFMARDTYPLARRGVTITHARCKAYTKGHLPPVPLDLQRLFDASHWPAGSIDSYVACRAAEPHQAGGTHGAAAPAGRHYESALADAMLSANGRVASGYAIARRTGIRPVAEDELRRSDRTGFYRRTGLSTRRLPLLPYLLKEAEVLKNGQTLGVLGSRLLTELVRGFIWASSEHSCLLNEWRPNLPRAKSETYSMLDLVTWTLRPTNAWAAAVVHNPPPELRIVSVEEGEAPSM